MLKTGMRASFLSHLAIFLVEEVRALHTLPCPVSSITLL